MVFNTCFRVAALDLKAGVIRAPIGTRRMEHEEHELHIRVQIESLMSLF